MSIIALDLNSIHLTSAMISRIGKMKSVSTFPLKHRSGDEVTELIINQINNLIKKYDAEHIRIKSVGISVPGIYNPQTGCVWAPNIPGWDNYPLKVKLLPLVKTYILNLKIANKRSCNIRGEYWLGAARRTRNAIYLSVNNGIGAGILVDGKILEGFNGGVGAVGWMSLDQNFDEKYMDGGYYEYHSSGKGIINLIQDAIKEDPNYGGYLKNINTDDLSIAHVFDAYGKNDKIATSVINQCIRYWGIAVANLISLFNPEKFIFGGKVFGPAFQFIDKIKREASERTHPQFFTNVKFVQSELGPYAALLGAGYLVNKKL
jgi:glucokinase